MDSLAELAPCVVESQHSRLLRDREAAPVLEKGFGVGAVYVDNVITVAGGSEDRDRSLNEVGEIARGKGRSLHDQEKCDVVEALGLELNGKQRPLQHHAERYWRGVGGDAGAPTPSMDRPPRLAGVARACYPHVLAPPADVIHLAEAWRRTAPSFVRHTSPKRRPLRRGRQHTHLGGRRIVQFPLSFPMLVSVLSWSFPQLSFGAGRSLSWPGA